MNKDILADSCVWQYKGNKIASEYDFDFNISDKVGFVYKITNLTKNKIYIGRKNFFSIRNVKLGKKELAALTDKRKKKTKEIIKPSFWERYTGSNKQLNEDILNGDSIVKEILEICDSKAKMTYFETKWQFKEGVIESECSYNQNILGKFYRRIFE